IMVDTRGIRPIAFDRHKSEAFLRDQLSCDPIAHAIKFRGSMACFTEKHNLCVTDPRHQSIELSRLERFERLAVSCNLLCKRFFDDSGECRQRRWTRPV